MKNISKSVLRRLPIYLTYLKSIEDADSPYISRLEKRIMLRLRREIRKQTECA